ncbi:sulfite exporter TauE/SafE family protein [Levilactobacillus tongjiangensis]|uniref:Probable membrane transporter protein n=1 Tax=Levilactobacillus tongjiangensis TaxID=2486023 RepID=A0ABW1SQD1_9LACO|nr:sulfite exporter TauE/SafE family protein [Levilactobacillus tongjiangensis]
MTWFFIILPALLAGLVQGLTGFGAVIIMMIFFPSILPMAQAAGVGGVIMLASVLTLAFRYRQHLHFKRIIIPFIIYAMVATWSVHLGHVLDAHLLRMLLGGLLVALCLYFTLAPGAGNQRYPWYIAGCFMIVSGFFNGLFGIGGPLMALYFLSLSKSMPEYIASIQTFFLIDTFYITSIRVANGILVKPDIPYILVGMVAATIGTIIASHLLTRLNPDTIKRWIYGFIGLSGIYYLFF